MSAGGRGEAELEDVSQAAESPVPVQPDRYAVMGHPIAHSKSPFIHRRFAAETGEPVAYDALLIEPGGFRAAVERFRAQGGRGLNVTIPFKEEAFALSSRRSERAERAGAVNTLWFDGAAVCSDNTDGAGLVRDLTRNLAVEVRARSVLLLGAGGAARGVLGPLLDEGPERLVIANRTAERAAGLARRFEGQGPVSAVALDALPAGGFDLVVNATAASLAGDLPPPAPGHPARRRRRLRHGLRGAADALRRVGNGGRRDRRGRRPRDAGGAGGGIVPDLARTGAADRPRDRGAPGASGDLTPPLAPGPLPYGPCAGALFVAHRGARGVAN